MAGKMACLTVPSLLIISAGACVLGFSPNLISVNPIGNSLTHKVIMENAVRRAAMSFMDDHEDAFPDQDAAMATDDFNAALGHFVDGVIRPDTEPHTRNDPSVHFDDEMIRAANDILLTARSHVITALSANETAAARDVAGELLHTLQDFYSHSNWVELDAEEPHTELGIPGGDLGRLAPPDQTTCTACDTLTCHDNIYERTFRRNYLLTGYRWRHPSEDLMTAGTSGRTVVDDVVFLILDSDIFSDDHCLLRRIALVESTFGTDPETYRPDYYGGIWQLDEGSFLATKDLDSTPELAGKHQAILNKFGVDWVNVEWTYLKIPFYSAIGARLFLSSIGEEIPSNANHQARFWENHYHTGTYSSNDFSAVIRNEEEEGDCPNPNVLNHKCSHGGEANLFDSPGGAVRIGASGGINKDTEVEEWSPHHYLHHQSALLAEDSTVLWFHQLRTVRTDEEYGRFLGLFTGSGTLCFVVDTTGSMGNEIAAVRQVTQEITEEYANSPDAPSDYVLVPFNDPDYGPVFMTEDSEAMKAELATLTARGGGDRPEMAYSGMRLAVLAVRPSSTCYVYTDAPAKDEHLQPEVDALAADKEVSMNFMLTDITKRKRRSTKYQDPEITSSIYQVYFDTAAISGGFVIMANSRDIEEASGVISAGLSASTVTLVQVEDIPGTGAGTAEHRIPIDLSLSELKITISSLTSGAIMNVQFIYPEGGDEGKVTVVTDLSNIKAYFIAKPSPGTLLVTLQSSRSYSFTVIARSTLGFTYSLMEPLPDGALAYRNIDGRPVSGQSVIFIFDIHGKDGAVQSVQSFSLVATNGSMLLQETPYSLRQTLEYEMAVNIPNEGFRVVMKAIDALGNPVHRVHPAVLIPTFTSLRLFQEDSDRLVVHPDDDLLVNVIVSNNGGPTSTYTITATDTLGLIQEFTPSTLHLASGSTGHVQLTIRAKGDSPLGDMSVVSVIAASSASHNSIVFRITEGAADPDVLSPDLNTTAVSGICNLTAYLIVPCDQEVWSIDFITQDTQSGLQQVRPIPLVASGNLTMETFHVGAQLPVKGSYRSTCCTPHVTIIASDMMGNFAQISIDHNDTADMFDTTAATIYYTTSESSNVSITTSTVTPSTTRPQSPDNNNDNIVTIFIVAVSQLVILILLGVALIILCSAVWKMRKAHPVNGNK